MATLIPSLNSCLSKMQAGEKRFAQRLEKLLEEDYLCWYDMPVGKRQRYADFIILHPLRGVLLLEVKDWKLESIQAIDKVSVTLKTDKGLKIVANPLEQARQCAYQLVQQLEQDPQLIAQVGYYQGKLAFPYGYGVVLTNITREQLDQHLNDVLPWNRTLCRDEMLETMDAEAFQQILWNMFSYQFNQCLTLPQIDRIRWHIFPEIRITPALQGNLFAQDATNSIISESTVSYALPDIMKVMDKQQEQLARSLGNGHRVIHGVAGSGKTLILGYRCQYLAHVLTKPTLVLCFNITLAARLRSYMYEQQINDRVTVYHFHDWCGELLRHYHIQKPKELEGEDYLTVLVDTVIKAVDKEHIPREQYGAVLIDEGHDFQPHWLKLIGNMINPATDSLLLLYDDAQSIYNVQGQLDFSLASVGIQARGRTTILKVNYRNTDEVFAFAQRLTQQYLSSDTQDSNGNLLPNSLAQSAGRHGFEPELRFFASFQEEVKKMVSWLQAWHEKRAMEWSAMCVLYRYAWQGEQLFTAMNSASIPCQWLHTKESKKHFDRLHESVKLMTMHSSKGLEFPLVAIVGVGFLGEKEQDKVAEAKLLYVAMTRATEKLVLTAHQTTEFTQLLQPMVVA